MSSDSKYLNVCNHIKVAMMISVIVFHSMALWQRGGWFNQPPADCSPILEYCCGLLGNMHTYCFTFISGYIFFYLINEKQSIINKREAIKKRIGRLLVPYIFVSCIWAIPFEKIYFDTPFSVIIKKYLFAASPSQLWFLVMIFNCFLLFLILHEYIHNMPPLVGIAVFAGLFIGAGYLEGIVPNVFQIISTCKYLVFYYAGYMIRKFQNTTLDFTKHRWYVYLFFYLLIYTIIFYGVEDNGSVLLRQILNLIMHFFGVFFVVCVYFQNNSKLSGGGYYFNTYTSIILVCICFISNFFM